MAYSSQEVNSLTYRFIIAVSAILLGSAFFSIYQNSDQPVLPARIRELPLHELAARNGLSLGTYVDKNALSESQYKSIVRRDFNLVVVDGQSNWHFKDGSLRPGLNDYDFSRVDELVKFAQAGNKPIRMHNLIWGEEKWLPDWLKNGSYTQAELREIMSDHIATVAGNYRGEVREWTVVNEAFSRSQNAEGNRDWWADKLGKEYINEAFLAARRADPNAVLILNDIGNETINPVSDAMYEHVKEMIRTGVPIDGIGMQMHINGNNPPTREAVERNMQRFGELGLQVYITEFDVNMAEIKGGDNFREDRQAEIYEDMIRACMARAECVNFSIKGVTDKVNHYSETGVEGAMPLPFDEDYKPKKAYTALRFALGTRSLAD